MSAHSKYSAAIDILNKLYFSRTGKAYTVLPAGDSDDERRTGLKRRICEEKILRVFHKMLHFQIRKKYGEHYSIDMRTLNPDDMAEAVVETAGPFLTNAELENLRRADDVEAGAYYDIDTNEKLPSDEEDLFAAIQKMQRRIVCDSNLPLPDPMNAQYAFILGQTADHEWDFWRLAKVKRGNENLFAFGVTKYQHCFSCLGIRRLRKSLVAAINKRKASIPDADTHYSTESRRREILVIIESYLQGKDSLAKQISELRTHYMPGSYQISILTARRCAALLLHGESPDLKNKVREEWVKFLSNHKNVLGDTQLIQNALYFDAEILTKDKGAKKMADYCGLKCLESV